MLRIISGQFKGLSLVTPGQSRPTGSKVREALFDIIGPFVEGARVLDGFAGSGALGIEAFSRGAAFVAFVDSFPDSIVAIRDNIARLGLEIPSSMWRVVHLQVAQGLQELAQTEPPFDIILFDPPYLTDEGKKALNAVSEYVMLGPAGIVAVEHDTKSVLPSSVGLLECNKKHRYGDTVLSFYQLKQ